MDRCDIHPPPIQTHNRTQTSLAHRKPHANAQHANRNTPFYTSATQTTQRMNAAPQPRSRYRKVIHQTPPGDGHGHGAYTSQVEQGLSACSSSVPGVPPTKSCMCSKRARSKRTYCSLAGTRCHSSILFPSYNRASALKAGFSSHQPRRACQSIRHRGRGRAPPDKRGRAQATSRRAATNSAAPRHPRGCRDPRRNPGPLAP